MNEACLRKTTGALFILISMGMLCCFIWLGVSLEYPEILRQGTGIVLIKYHQAGNIGPMLYYGLMIAALMLIFEAVLFQRVFEDESRNIFLELGKQSGICAGFAFIFGFMRWVFLVPQLARGYSEAAKENTSEALEIMFRAFDTYLGFSIGEHIGFMFLSLMLLFFGMALIQSRRAPSWIGWCGTLIGLGVLYGNTEAFGFPLSFIINRSATKLSLVWMMAVGVILLLAKSSVRGQSED